MYLKQTYLYLFIHLFIPIVKVKIMLDPRLNLESSWGLRKNNHQLTKSRRKERAEKKRRKNKVTRVIIWQIRQKLYILLTVIKNIVEKWAISLGKFRFKLECTCRTKMINPVWIIHWFSFIVWLSNVGTSGRIFMGSPQAAKCFIKCQLF